MSTNRAESSSKTLFDGETNSYRGKTLENIHLIYMLEAQCGGVTACTTLTTQFTG